MTVRAAHHQAFAGVARAQVASSLSDVGRRTRKSAPARSSDDVLRAVCHLPLKKLEEAGHNRIAFIANVALGLALCSGCRRKQDLSIGHDGHADFAIELWVGLEKASWHAHATRVANLHYRAFVLRLLTGYAQGVFLPQMWLHK